MLTVEEKLLARSVRDEATGCLRWTGAHIPQGYGQVVVSGRRGSQRVHRVAHELWIGPIPEGYDVDHVKERGCAHRDCIEPSHLEAVTHRENLLRGIGPSAINARKARCKHGHRFSPGNTRIDAKGDRICRTCDRAKRARSHAKRKVQRSARRAA